MVMIGILIIQLVVAERLRKGVKLVKLLLCLSLAFFFQQGCETVKTQSTNQKLETKSAQQIKATPTPKREKKSMNDKESLAKGIEAINPSMAEIIRSEKSKIATLETSFLRDGEIYLVKKFSPTRMIQIYIGTSDEQTFLIGGEAERYYEFIEKAKPILDRDELRIAYLKNFLQVTKTGKGRFKIVESVDEIKERPNLKDQQKQEFAKFIEKYKHIIKPPQQTNNESKYEFFVIKDQSLVKLTLKIIDGYKVEQSEEVLEEKLLIPYTI